MKSNRLQPCNSFHLDENRTRRRALQNRRYRIPAGMTTMVFVLVFVICSSRPLGAQNDSIRSKWELGFSFRETGAGHYEDRKADTLNWRYDTESEIASLFAIREISHHNFLRLSFGIGHSSDDHYRMDGIEGGALVQTYRLAATSLGTEFAFGHDVVPFSSPGWDRIRFRLGLGMRHEIVIFDQQTSQSVATDSTGAVTEQNEETYLKKGEQSLQLKAFGQVGFRVFKGLFLGLEWSTGPSLEFGRLATHFEGTTVDSQGAVTSNSYDRHATFARLRYRNSSFGAPTFTISWKF